MKPSIFILNLMGATALSVPALASDVVVNQFNPQTPATQVDAWYLTDMRGAGTATIESLAGKGGNLEAAQPLPTGAARLTTGAANADKAEVATFANFGRATDVLKSIDLSYNYYKSPNSLENAAAPSIKLALLGTGTGDNYGQLVYEPYWSPTLGTPSKGAWQSVVIDETSGAGTDQSGGWWWTGGFEVPNSAGGPPLRSLAEWDAIFSASDADYGNAQVVSLAIGVGTYNKDQDDYFDAVAIKTGGVDKKYDFQTQSVPDGGATALMLGMATLGLLGFSRRSQKA